MPKVLTRTKAAPGEPKASDHWRTEPWLFDALDDEFAFDLDLAADAENHLVDRWLGPGGVYPDALGGLDWTRVGHTGFLNPPYSSELIRPFMAKAAVMGMFMTVVVLVPYSPDTKWWTHSARAVEIREIPHRVKYLKADGVTAAGAMFPSAVLIFRPQPGILRADPRRVVWDYPTPARSIYRDPRQTDLALGDTERVLVSAFTSSE